MGSPLHFACGQKDQPYAFPARCERGVRHAKPDPSDRSGNHGFRATARGSSHATDWRDRTQHTRTPSLVLPGASPPCSSRPPPRASGWSLLRPPPTPSPHPAPAPARPCGRCGPPSAADGSASAPHGGGRAAPPLPGRSPTPPAQPPPRPPPLPAADPLPSSTPPPVGARPRRRRAVRHRRRLRAPRRRQAPGRGRVVRRAPPTPPPAVWRAPAADAAARRRPHKG